uniref:50S ribosomal protein L22 n=1 Tax=uncultured archaeon Rifle_16ft_4_minimus_1461 TaxID=1665151 RepID=A0A0H4TKR0_9ARCH|nr:50S ribosomal protein L22P [uncultured archaeon]AKQ01099.1 50S ribosomal protein L22, large subunit ribosomal protein L22 [uncultured archaeon Rifle_16ft_4_minimus_1461]
MTEKNYNPEQKHAKNMEKMNKANKTDDKKILETPKNEVKVEKPNEEVKKEVKKTEKQKKTEAIVRGMNLPISSKQSFAICKFIKNKEINRAINELEEILAHKRALPMKGEIPHRRGKGMMSGRYPQNSVKEFIKLLKSLNANATANEMSNPFICEAQGNFASRPFGRFGRVRKKRSHVTILAKEKALMGKGAKK